MQNAPMILKVNRGSTNSFQSSQSIANIEDLAIIFQINIAGTQDGVVFDLKLYRRKALRFFSEPVLGNH